MLDYKTNSKGKDKKKKENAKKRSKQLWPHLLILLSKTRKNKSELKTKKWSGISKTNLEKKNRSRKGVKK